MTVLQSQRSCGLTIAYGKSMSTHGRSHDFFFCVVQV